MEGTFLATAGMVGGGMYLIWLGWLMMTDKNAAWERHRRRLEARGIKPVRSAGWERQVRRDGAITLAFGAALLAGAFFLPGMILGGF